MPKKYFLLLLPLPLLCTCDEDLSRDTGPVVFKWDPQPVLINVPGMDVDPLVGTDGHGHTFPGATSPFGMVQLSPDTRVDGSWDGCSGYHYSDSIIYGFSHTHLSGTGCSDYGDVLVMPVDIRNPADSAAWFNNGADGKPGYRSRFRHETERASAGHYEVGLDDAKVDVRLTASPRVGMHEYITKYPALPGLVLDLRHRDETLDAHFEYVNDSTVRGYRFSKAWAQDQRVFFCMRFSRPLKGWVVQHEGKRIRDPQSVDGKDLCAVLDFGSKETNNMTVRVALSGVSMDGAELNLETEAPGSNFSGLQARVSSDWARELTKVQIQSDDVFERRKFYTALYHCFIAPNVYSDVDGRYRGRDNKIHIDTGGPQYTVFSLWDTYRALHPLFTIVQQERTNDFIRSFIRQWEQGGRLPVWELSANETDCMIGYHAVPVIADAYVKGLRDYNTEKALQAMLASAQLDRSGLKDYKSCGYIPAEGESESVSKTLEYGYDDWCIAQVAKQMGKENVYKEFIKRAQAWENLYDPKTNFMRARLNNAFVEPFAPEEVNFHYTEANAWQYSLAVPHDVNGLMQRMGGKEALEKHLDNLFSAPTETSGREQADITGLIGQYAHGNEPSHHMAYLYCFAGKPLKTQQRVHEIMSTLYTDKPDGLSGNEDCGQMSAWYVMSALGFYPVTPGSDQYVIGTPRYVRATIRLENGKKFTVSASGFTPGNPFVNGMRLDGKEWHKGWITHGAIMNGGELEFIMSDNPVQPLNADTWKQLFPYEAPSMGIAEADRIVPVPLVLNTSRTFEEEMQVSFAGDDQTKIFISVNAQPFVLWRTILKIAETSTIKAYAEKNNKRSDTATFTFYKMEKGRKLQLLTKYAPQYAAGGDLALIDGLRGPDNFRTGSWQGYQGVDVEAVIDLGKTRDVKTMRIGFLQDQGSWIFMPEEVTFFVSADGKNFTAVHTQKNTIDPRKDGVALQDFICSSPQKGVRFVKVKAKNRGTCPDWHPGKGNEAWIFADEIVIE